MNGRKFGALAFIPGLCFPQRRAHWRFAVVLGAGVRR
jgi:hypothetical protein